MGTSLRPAVFELERRRPVWDALAELFLNDSAFEDDERADWLLRKMAESGYTVQELESILVEEVAPALYPGTHDICD